MAIQNLYPLQHVFWQTNLSGSATYYQLTTTKTKLAAVFVVPKTGSITHVAIRTGNVTTAAALRVSLQTLNASGNPTGVNYGGSSSEVIATPAANTVYEIQLTTPASAVKDDVVALVVEWDSTAGALYIATAIRRVAPGFPYDTGYSSGAWAAAGSRATQTMMGAVKYGVDGYEPCTLPAIATGGSAPLYNSGSTPDEYGNQFTLSHPARCWGALVEHTATNALGNYDVVLYDGNGQQLSVVSIAGALQADFDSLVLARFSTPIDLNAGTYFITKKPTTTTNCKGRYLTFYSQEMLKCMNWGRDDHMVSRTDGGAWTHDYQSIFNIVPLFSGFSDGVGGGVEYAPGLFRGVET